MKPLCLVPWTSIDISPRGYIAPCCKFEADGTQPNIVDTTIQEYTDSDFLHNIKQTMQGGEFPKGCVRCRIEEENGIKSKRELDYIRWQTAWDNYTPDQGYIVASIAFGNTCNLKCITCGPHSSSRWRKEYIDLYGVDKTPVETIDNAQAEDIYSALPNAIHFDIPGGEPFLSEVDKQLELLERYVQSGQAQHMGLHYTTNAQQFPEEQWWKLWSNFREVDIQLSIDGVGDRYEYIRHPASYDRLLETVDQYLAQPTIKLSVSHTVSAYNIYYMDEFFAWCATRGLPTPWCGRVHTPSHMQPCVYPHHQRMYIAANLYTSKYPEVKNWSKYLTNNDSSDHYAQFIQERDRHDLYRNLNFAETFPEVEELINGF